MIKTKELISYQGTLIAEFLDRFIYPWLALPEIHSFIKELGVSLAKEEFNYTAPDIWIHKSVKVAATATLSGPLIVCAGSEIRPGAFIRGNVFVGENCVVGNSTELKNSILVEHVEVPHYNYVGDSILAPYSHMGAGSITSNIKADRKNIVIHDQGQELETGLRKIGAILGDHVEIGCNAVLNPGTIVGKYSRVYPLSMVRGVIPEKHIYKNNQQIVPLED